MGIDHPGDRRHRARAWASRSSPTPTSPRCWSSEGRATGVVTRDGRDRSRRRRSSPTSRRQDPLSRHAGRRGSCRTRRCATSAASAPSRPRSRSTSPASARRNTRSSTSSAEALGGFDYPTYVHIAPDIDYLERAYDDAKYGWYSTRPFITPVVPTIRDDTLAPPGKHVVNLFGGHAPYELKGASWASRAATTFRKTVLDTIETFAPGLSRRHHRRCRSCSPPDIEQIVGLPQGHIFHGELAPDQLFFQRPVAGYADYRTPIRGLYVCGISMHPGGGVGRHPRPQRGARDPEGHGQTHVRP